VYHLELKRALSSGSFTDISVVGAYYPDSMKQCANIMPLETKIILYRSALRTWKLVNVLHFWSKEVKLFICLLVLAFFFCSSQLISKR
jgi:hypothetical protein